MTMGDRWTTGLFVDVISDVICPWCYIAKRRLEQAVACPVPFDRRSPPQAYQPRRQATLSTSRQVPR